MAAFLDVCRFTPTVGGTTDWTYAVAVTGYQSPAAAGIVNGSVYSYRAESADLSQWEVGTGAYSGGVLARTTVLFNSSGTTAKINFSATPQVAIVALKEDLLSMSEANNFATAQLAQGRSNLYAAPFDALAFSGMQVNGAMDVSQENGTTQITLANTSSKYIVDGLFAIYNHAAATAVFKGQQVTPPGSPSFGAAFPNCLQLTSTTALTSPAAGDYCRIVLPIEGYRLARLGFGNANAQSLTIGFWVYATIPGTAAVSIRNSALNRCYVATFAVNNPITWEYKTVSIPGDQSGTWATTTGIGSYITFDLFSGPTFQTTAGSWQAGSLTTTSAATNFFASNNNAVCVTGVVVVPGSEAPAPARSPFIMRPYSEEMRVCKRYWWHWKEANSSVIAYGGPIVSTTRMIALVNYPEEMRINPTYNCVNPGHALLNDGAGGFGTCTSSGLSGTSGVLTSAIAFDASAASFTSGRVSYILSNNADFEMQFNARL